MNLIILGTSEILQNLLTGAADWKRLGIDQVFSAASAEEADRILADANAEANEVRLGAMSYTKQKLSDMRDFFAATLEADRENYKNLVDSLENSVFTLETNMSEVDASIGLLTGVQPVQPIQQAQPSYAAQQMQMAAAADDDFDPDEFDEEDDDFDDDSDYDDDDEDDEDDDFLDE